MKHKGIRILLCLMLFVVFIPLAAYGESSVPSTGWNDYAADSFAGGTGSVDDPYKIATAEQLAKLSKDVAGGERYAGKYFRLENDLDLKDHCWVPIGLYKWMESGSTTNKPFGGYFDGNGKKISGLIVDQRNDQYCGGLFGNICCASAGVKCGVKDLTIAGGSVYNKGNGLMETNNGILAGFIMTNEGCTVEFSGITVSGGTIRIEGSCENGRPTGGMLGNANRVKAANCKVENIDISGVDNSGGFVGMDSGSTYKDCTASGKVSGDWGLGGFTGYATTNGSLNSEFDHCLADVKIEAADWRPGGFIGLGEGAKISHCVAKGNVNSTVDEWEPKAGAFAGELSVSTVEASHAAGTVTAVSTDYEAGGFAGVNDNSTFKDCSFDSTLNKKLSAIGGSDPKAQDGIQDAATQQVKGNICRDYDYRHTLTEAAGKDPGCTEDGYKAYWNCAVCGTMYSDQEGKSYISEPEAIDATGHDLTKTEGKAASCTEDGYKEYWTCSKCDKMFSDEEGKTEISNPEVIKATGHDMGGWKVTKKAKPGVEGAKERSCKNCDYTETAVIPAEKPADEDGKSARTGDDMNIALYGLLALLAAAGACGTLYRRKKNS